jgi:hypothetical protein
MPGNLRNNTRKIRQNNVSKENTDMTKQTNSKGFSLMLAIAIVLVVAVIGLGGWYAWNKNRKNDIDKEPIVSSQNKDKDKKKSNETDAWVSVTTQLKVFSMKVPDGWSLTNYPNDFLGSLSTVFKPGTPAEVKTSDTEYAGHSLRFRASVSTLDDAGLGPQWASPQPGLEESTQDFSIGELHGKRFKGVFTGDLNQTLYEYIFDLGGNKKLDIVYTVYHAENEKDDVATVEKAISTIDTQP